MLSRLLTLTLIVIPFVQAGLFDADSGVKMLDTKGFRNVMRENRTAVVAFVAPWCGHCQKLSPEYARAAGRLKPLIPLYAVDCDAETNKRLCAEQGVRGFPTLKIFKRGSRSPGVEYQGPRTNNDIYNWAKGTVPNVIEKVTGGSGATESVSNWQFKNRDKPRVLLLNKTNKLPLLWVVLGNQFDKKITFGNVRDRRGQLSKAMGFPYNEEHRKPKIIVWAAESKEPVMYEGLLKYDALSKFFKELAAGKADMSKLLSAFKEEKEAIPEMEMRKQEADAIMQGKGYGNPHAGMQVGEDGLPPGDMHAGHGGADYAKYVQDAQDQAAKELLEDVEGGPKTTVKAATPQGTSQANFDDIDLSAGGGTDGMDEVAGEDGESNRENRDEL